MVRLILVLTRILLLHVAVGVLITAGIFYVLVKEQRVSDLAHADERLRLAAHTVRFLIEPTDSALTFGTIDQRIEHYVKVVDNRLSVHVSSGSGAPLFESSDLALLHRRIHESEAAMIAPVTFTDGTRSYRVHWEHAGQFHVTVAHEIYNLWGTAAQMGSTLIGILILIMSLLLGGGLITGLSVMRMIRRYGQYLQSQIDDADRNASLQAFPAVSVGWQLFIGPIYEIVRKLHTARNQALSFASYASHEIRTPLTIMLHQLGEGLSSDVRHPSLRLIVSDTYDNVLRLQHTIEDLLSLATMQAGTFRLNRVSVEFNQMLRKFTEEAKLLARPNNVRVVFSRGPSANVMVDLHRFRQVLFNLLDNALKYTNAGGTIRIACSVETASVVLTFSDNGRGISTEALPHIFQPFYRGNGSDEIRGSGLGLALIRWIVDLHGGSATAASDPGHGTTFTIRIPREVGPPLM